MIHEPNPEDLPIVGWSHKAAHGCSIVEEITERPIADGGLGWLYRPVPQHDFGVDAQLEVTVWDDSGVEHPTARILSLQIKTGSSYFDGDKGNSWHLYVEKPVMKYWLSHSVPVIFVLVDDKDRCVYWVRADAEWHKTEKHYRIEVPKANKFDSSARDDLNAISLNQTDFDVRLAALENKLHVD